MDMGFEQEGFKIVWANENNPSFVSLHSEGYNNWRRTQLRRRNKIHRESASIETLRPRQILRAAFGDGKPEIFGIIGGPPCPDFSNAGRHKGHRGENGKLTRDFVDLICELKPSFFVLENVAGLARFTKHRRFLNRIKKQLAHAGYVTDAKILNALEFGVPQFRERLFVVGLRRKLAYRYIQPPTLVDNGSWYPWPLVEKYTNAATVFDWPAITRYGRRPVKPKGIPRELCVLRCLVPKSRRGGIPNANNIFKTYSKKYYRIKEGDTLKKSFKRLHRYRYSPTACYGNREVHLHPWEPRRLSLREAMRIQGIPDSYVLPEDVPLSTTFRMVSNGVPVPLARHVAQSLMDVLRGAFA